MPIAETRVGPQQAADGATPQPTRSGRTGETVVADAHGRYQEATVRGNVFFATVTSAQAFGATLTATTTTGIINPANSGKNLVLLRLGVILSTQPALGTLVTLATSSTLVPTVVTTSANTTLKNALLNQTGASVALVEAATANTLTGTPYVVYPLMEVSATTVALPLIDIDFAGLFAVPPGGAIAINCSAATSGIPTFVWEEVLV